MPTVFFWCFNAQKFLAISALKHSLTPFRQVLIFCSRISSLSFEVLLPTNTASLIAGGMSRFLDKMVSIDLQAFLGQWCIRNPSPTCKLFALKSPHQLLIQLLNEKMKGERPFTSRLMRLHNTHLRVRIVCWPQKAVCLESQEFGK